MSCQSILPELEDFKPHGRPEPPLEKASDDWLYPVIDGVRYKRETNTMPQWAGSCWYFLRFIDARNDECFVDPELEKQWMPVDLYIGGAEHAVLHLLYATILAQSPLRSRPFEYARALQTTGQSRHDPGRC